LRELAGRNAAGLIVNLPQELMPVSRIKLGLRLTRGTFGSEIGESEFRFRAIPNRPFGPPERALNPGVQVVCNQLTT
jgi:hypothetical protein